MRTYKIKSKKSEDTYEQAAAILEADKTKKVRGIAKDFMSYVAIEIFIETKRNKKEGHTYGISYSRIP